MKNSSNKNQIIVESVKPASIADRYLETETFDKIGLKSSDLQNNFEFKGFNLQVVSISPNESPPVVQKLNYLMNKCSIGDLFYFLIQAIFFETFISFK